MSRADVCAYYVRMARFHVRAARRFARFGMVDRATQFRAAVPGFLQSARAARSLMR